MSMEESKPIFLIGNGVNRWGCGQSLDWCELCKSMLSDFGMEESLADSASDNSLPEILDLLQIHRELLADPGESIPVRFVNKIEQFTPKPVMKDVARGLQKIGHPILSLNFDNILTEALGITVNLKSAYPKMDSAPKGIFSKYYPWDKCFKSPTNELEYWPIHGHVSFSQSMRLTASHYSNAIAKARKIIKGLYTDVMGEPRRDLDDSWIGKGTWIEHFFHRPIIVMGAGLGQSENFLRWLLIQRYKYQLAQNQQNSSPSLFLSVKTEQNNAGRFLKGLGFKVVDYESYDALYGQIKSGEDPWEKSR